MQPLQDKLSLGIDLLPEAEEDVIIAKMVNFGGASPGEGDIEDKVREVLEGKAMFEDKRGDKDGHNERDSGERRGMTKAQIQAEEARIGLGDKLRKNTRSRMDPFWSGLAGRNGVAGSVGGSEASSRTMSRDRGELTPPRVLVGLKRKKAGTSPAATSRNARNSPAAAEAAPNPATSVPATSAGSNAALLVDYGSSDSD